MWDEEINKKIKDAADQYHPAYDDNAWDKMEQMLDEHLPRKKDRRRIIYILLPLVLLLGGVLFFVIPHKEIISSSEKTVSKGNIEKSPHENQNSSSAIIANANPITPDGKLIDNVKGKNSLGKEPVIIAGNTGTKKIRRLYGHGNSAIVNTNATSSENKLTNNEQKSPGNKPVSIKVNAKTNSSIKNSTRETTYQPEKSPGKAMLPAVAGDPAVADNNNPLQKINTTVTKDKSTTIKSKDVAKTENAKENVKVAGSNKQKIPPKKNFIQNFGISLSVGPDVSAVNLNNTGKVTLTYGAGLSYSFTGRFTLRTGFYVAKKIYSVDDEEYHVPAGTTWNTFLQSVDANCKVYEIPLTLSYNFGKTKNHNWFASAGLSSYFMKRESYVYYYKTPLGVSYNTPWTIRNQNKHYFSVLDISGGYAYSINKRFSLSAEPYLKLPLSGIGLGKIKLNSAGVLFTVAIKPF